jgi:hypothetical protein
MGARPMEAGEDDALCRVPLLEPRGESLDLGGFAGTVKTFEGDKETARHGRSLPLELIMHMVREAPEPN